MHSRAERAADWLAARERVMESALAALVDINSHTENPEGGRKVGEVLAELFSSAGLTATARPSDRYADHWIFRSRAALPNRNAVALVGHLDTVFPPGTFEGYRREGAFGCGPGVLDMKGGLVVAAFALKALAETGGLDDLAPVRVVVVSDEEVGSPEGQGVLGAAISGVSACLVFEAGRSGDLVVTRRKGTGAVTALAHGKAAHAGNALAEGCNAVWALARFIDRAQDLTDETRGVSVNVGRVSGGHSRNTVPDAAEAQLDVRFCTKDDGSDLVASLQRIASDAARSVPGTRIELRGGITRLPLERTAESAALYLEYAACARAHGLGGGEAALVGGGSDASTAAAMGIAAIDGLGPRGTGFHTAQERIEIETLVPKAQALARFLAGRSAA